MASSLTIGTKVNSNLSRWWKLAAAAALLGCLIWAGLRFWPRPLSIRMTTLVPVVSFSDGRPVIAVPGRAVVAEVARYNDELFACLMAGYLRGTSAFRDSEVMMTYRQENHRMVYSIQIRPVATDLASGLFLLYSAKARGLIADANWQFVNAATLGGFRRQNGIFEMSYNFPVRRHFDHLTRAELIRYASRFIRFKSASDPRTWRRNVASLSPLVSAQALQLSADIVTVAQFYSLPLDFFLGIGAMENNYMNADGDLGHTTWKRRAATGDIVLKRAGGRVLVRNSSQGVWQITRETLRHTHDLYLADSRDYGRLPAALRPPKDLDLDHVDPRVLTTYAGLLFRELLDRCGGDVDTALGAYNGGLGNPNMAYAQGVRAAAEHARSVVEHAAVLSGPVAGRRFLTVR